MDRWCIGLLAVAALLVPEQTPQQNPEQTPQQQSPQEEGPGEPAPAASPYVTALRAAAAALESHDLDAAQRALDATELERRGFEWDHLHLALDLARTASAGPGVDAPAGLSKAHVATDASEPQTSAISLLRRSRASGRALAL